MKNMFSFFKRSIFKCSFNSSNCGNNDFKALLNPTGLKLKVQRGDIVKMECNYNPYVWVRLFQCRKWLSSIKNQANNQIEWLSEYVIGSTTSKVLFNLKDDQHYVFRIVHIGHNDERVYSDELSLFTVKSAGINDDQIFITEYVSKEINSIEYQCYAASWERYRGY